MAFLLVEQDVLNCLSKHGLTQSVINVCQLILNLLLRNLFGRLELGLDHAYNLCNFAIQKILFDTSYHTAMCKHDNSESNHLCDLCPHIRAAYHLSNQEEKEELCDLCVQDLRKREVCEGLEVDNRPENCQK